MCNARGSCLLINYVVYLLRDDDDSEGVQEEVRLFSFGEERAAWCIDSDVNSVPLQEGLAL